MKEKIQGFVFDQKDLWSGGGFDWYRDVKVYRAGELIAHLLGWYRTYKGDEPCPKPVPTRASPKRRLPYTAFLFSLKSGDYFNLDFNKVTLMKLKVQNQADGQNINLRSNGGYVWRDEKAAFVVKATTGVDIHPYLKAWDSYHRE